ncbi:RidA family protein [Acuticoccus mangrovi]|uniref:RidA family protein n=1 Tax=Acuticoccus mangrovi TaxID=2796142 RepID=A0A934MEH8_9HYPH|nr:RidA family protein [Acuticoccus mangrovi]MBJ3777537.1 RidA family protein [Acuticoccus mangrovi]
MTDIHLAPPGRVRQRLTEAGIGLPDPHVTHFDYIPVSIHGTTAYLAGQIPKTDADEILVTGRLGESVGVEDGKAAARLAAGQGLAWLDALAGGLDNVARVLRMDFFCAVDDAFADMSLVADAASGILVAAFGEAGRHPRSVIGVRRLPRNSPVLLDLAVALHASPANAALPARQPQEPHLT